MSGITWVYIMLGIYVIYAFWQGLQGFFAEKTSAGYAIGGRSVPFIAFLMAATAASFSGWTFIGHPGLIWRDGLAYAFASFYVLTIPISGTFFAKRQWLLGKRYGFITPGDMYAYYFNSEPLRILVVITALLYSLFYSAVQMMASAALFQWVAGIDFVWGAWIMAFIVWFYVCTGGMKASAWVGVFQFVFLVGGIVLLGYYVINRPEFGGWTQFSATVGKLNKSLLEVPSVMFMTSDAPAYAKANKTVIWTAVMCLTYMFSLMGIQSSPAFTMNFFGIKSPKVLGWQQAFMSTFVVGFALFYFTAIQGMGAKVLEVSGILKFTKDSDVVPLLMANYLPPFVLGVVFLGAIAAIHSTAAPYINTGGSILLRDIWWRIHPQTAGRPRRADLDEPTLRHHPDRRFGNDRPEFQGRPGHPGGARHGLRLRDVRPADRSVLGLPLSQHRRRPWSSVRHGCGVPDLLCLAEPPDPALRLLGRFRRPVGRLPLQGAGHERQRGDDQAPERDESLPRQHRRAQRGGQEVARGHEDRHPALVFLRHRPGLHHGQLRLLFRRVPAAVVLADRLVDHRHRHDVGAVLQVRAVDHQRGAVRAGREGKDDRGQGNVTG